MYLEFYGLKEPPFSITPDPRYLYLSERHAEALAHLLYGINDAGGFVQLTGEVGTGKTTLCRLLLEQLPEHTRVALVLNPKLSPVELLETIAGAWWSGIVPTTGGGQKVVTFGEALVFQHVHESAECTGPPGSWAKPARPVA